MSPELRQQSEPSNSIEDLPLSPQRLILHTDGELSLVDIPDGMVHRDAIAAQKQDIAEQQRQITEIMSGHIKTLVEANDNLGGDLFFQNGKGPNTRLLSTYIADYSGVRPVYLFVSQHGFYEYNTVNLPHDSGLKLLNDSHFMDPKLLIGQMVDFDFRISGPLDSCIFLKKINIDEANESINWMIGRILEKQMSERALLEQAIERITAEVDDGLDRELLLPEIPKRTTTPLGAETSAWGKVKNFFQKEFVKKKK